MAQSTARAALIAAALLTDAYAPAAAADRVVITNAWLRALPANLPAGGYFTLHNGTARALTLIGANSPACGVLMLHKSEEMSGVSSMSDVPSIKVPPGGTLTFAPGGYHLMCTGPSALLRQSAMVPVTLDFADGSKLDASFLVRSATGR